MKNIIKLARTALILLLFMGWNLAAMAQAPPPPPGEHGGDQNVPANGGGAPIGGGIAILLTLGAAWGGKKVYEAYKDRE